MSLNRILSLQTSSPSRRRRSGRRGVSRHFMPSFGNSDAILVATTQLHSLHIINKRLRTPNIVFFSLPVAILIHNVLHCHSGGGPILRVHVAAYTVEIMRRRSTDVIDMGMVYIPDVAELCLRVFGWVPTIAEVPWFRGGLLDVFGRWSCSATIGINMNCLFDHRD